MYKLNSILLISSQVSGSINYTNILSELSIANEVKVVENINDGVTYLGKYGNEHLNCCPELIFLDFTELLKQGIEFLEAFSKLYFANKAEVRIVFMTSDSDAKEASTLKVLGDFEFLDRPFSEENFYNCLITVPTF